LLRTRPVLRPCRHSPGTSRAWCAPHARASSSASQRACRLLSSRLPELGVTLWRCSPRERFHFLTLFHSPSFQSLILVTRLCARSAVIVGGFSGLYRLLRLVFGNGRSSDSGVAVFLSAGLSAQTLMFLSPAASKELALYAVKFVLEGLINSSPKGSITEQPGLQRLAMFILFGLLVMLFEKQPSTLKPMVVRLLNALWA